MASGCSSQCGRAYPILRAVRESTDARSSHTRGTALLGSGSSSSIWRCLFCSYSSSRRMRSSCDTLHAVKVSPQTDCISIVLPPFHARESIGGFFFPLCSKHTIHQSICEPSCAPWVVGREIVPFRNASMANLIKEGVNGYYINTVIYMMLSQKGRGIQQICSCACRVFRKSEAGSKKL
jgi:hypothetical protein